VNEKLLRRAAGKWRPPLVLLPVIAISLGNLAVLVFGPESLIERVTLGIGAAAVIFGVVLAMWVGREAETRGQRMNALVSRLAHSRQDLTRGFDIERHQLRRDLHDTLGPVLAISVMRIDLVRRLVERDQAAADQALVELREETRAAVAQVRRLIYELRPACLEPPQRLLTALLLQAEQFNRASDGKLTVTVRSVGDASVLSGTMQMAAFRIASEALTNVLRHADANQCDITVSVTDRLTVEVRDNGVGLQARSRWGLGLRSIRERAGELGGRCCFDSLQPHGTRVRVDFPLQTSNQEAESGRTGR
jgi:signal transduction histidine kinase